jgi:hypothetical protein
MSGLFHGGRHHMTRDDDGPETARANAAAGLRKTCAALRMTLVTGGSVVVSPFRAAAAMRFDGF